MQSRRRPRTRSLVIFIAVAILAVWAGLFALGRSGPEPDAFTARGAGPNGYKALALLYEELGYRVQTWDAPFRALPAGVQAPSEAGSREGTGDTTDEAGYNDGETGAAGERKGTALLVVAQPRAERLGTGDLASLAEWVSEGHTALLLGLPRSAGDRELLGPVPLPPGAPGNDAGNVAAWESAGEGTIVRRPVGEGTLVAVTDPSVATNRGIGAEGHAAFLAHVARQAGARAVWIAEPPGPDAAGASPSGWQARRGVPSLDDALPLVENAIPEALEALPPIEDGLRPVGTAHVAVAAVVSLWAIGRRLGGGRPRAPLGKRDGRDARREPAVGRPRGKRPFRSRSRAAPGYVAAAADRYRQAGAAARGHVLAVQYDALVQALALPSGSVEDASALAARFAAPLHTSEKSLAKLFARCHAVIEGKAVSERELVKLSKAIERCRRSLYKRSETIE